MANEGVVCGKWGKKSKAVLEEAALAVKLLFQTCDFFCIWKKSVVEIGFALKGYFSIYTQFHSVFTIIIAEYCTLTQADCHYETKILVTTQVS